MDLQAEMKEAVCRSIDELSTGLITLSHEIHAEPELAFAEVKSSARLAAYGGEQGLPVQQKAYGLETALSAEVGAGEYTVAILSEYDALPGIGHACGHNIIAAAGIGAVVALDRLGSALPGRIRWLGTPAEERGCGKELMAQAGALEGVQFAMMVHPAGVDSNGINTLCIADAEVVFHGRAAHAAVNPMGGLNALDAVVSAYQNLAALRQHLNSGDIVNAVIMDGGKAPNVIPDQTRLAVFLRAPNAFRLKGLKERFSACIEAGALGAGCTAEVSWAKADYLNFKYNQPFAQAYQTNAEALGREFIDIERLPPGGTDMGNFSHRVPCLHPLISCSPPDVLIHDPEFARYANSIAGDRAVLDGAKGLAMTVIDLLTDESLRLSISAQFEATEEESRRAVESVYRPADQRLAAAGCC